LRLRTTTVRALLLLLLLVASRQMLHDADALVRA
jgi:hypothetical protein